MVKRLRRALSASIRALSGLLLCAGCEATVGPTEETCVGDDCQLTCAEGGCAGASSLPKDAGTDAAEDAATSRPSEDVAPVPTLEVVDRPTRDAGSASESANDAGRGVMDAGSLVDASSSDNADDAGEGIVSAPVLGVDDAGDAVDNSGSDAGLGDAGDAGTSDSADAGAPPVQLPPCNSGAFLEPELIENLGVSGDYWGPAWSPDGLVLYFSVSGPDVTDAEFGEAIYRTERDDRESPFTTAEPVAELNLYDEQGTPHVSADGRLLLFFADDGGGRNLFGATLDTGDSTVEAGTWTNIVEVPTVNANANDDLPWLSIDESTLYFTSGRVAGEGSDDIWASTRTDSGYAYPVALEAINSTAADRSPTLSPDELTLYFISDRGTTNRDRVYAATRSSTADAFENPTLVSELSETGDTVNLALSRDGREIAMTSNREGEDLRLWVSRRDCPPLTVPLPTP